MANGAEHHYAECRIFMVMLSVIMLIAVMLCIVEPSKKTICALVVEYNLMRRSGFKLLNVFHFFK
jgi:hypothetical protein